jgi:hypothetical protein
MFNRSSLLFTNYSVIGRIYLFALLVVFLGCFSFTSVAPAQTPADKDRPQTPGGASSGQTFAPIGESGYRVPIPEIKMKNIIGGRPSKEAPAVPPEQKRLPAPSTEPPRARPMPKEVPAPQIPRLPFDHREPVPKAESAPVAPAKKETEEKNYRSPLLKAPVVPEDFTAALPSPKKEVLPKTATQGLPTLMDVAPVKETLKALSLDRTEIDDMADPRLWIRLDPRREAEAASLEPEPGALGPKEEIRPRPLPEEPAPKESIQEPIEQRTSPKEGVPREGPAKESIPSPFDPQAATDPAVASYLKAAAPILEELSLVMAKTPSLTVADYDPSEANAPVFPKELVLKLDSVKRELQVLDSKTFEIIPPPRYVPFHSLIRQSITQTYQACDEIINYLNQKDRQSIQKVREHLIKARELIQRTREQTLG